MTTPRRTRRSPEEARTIILSAAEKVFAERGPDAAGLADVARAAGVSPALVSHYFGTYESLVESAFEAYVARVRARLLERIGTRSDRGAPVDVEAAIDELFAALVDPAYSRLALWALLSGRVDHRDFFPRRRRGLKLVVDAIAESLASPTIERAAIELVVVQVLSTMVGYVSAGSILWESVGHERTARRDADVRASISRLIRTVLVRTKR